MNVRTSIRQELLVLWGDGKGRSLAAVAIGWGLLNGIRMAYPALIPYLETSYGLGLTSVGLLVTVLGLFSAIGQLPGGILADKYAEPTLMAVGIGTVAVALGLVVTASSTAVLFFATAIWGLGHSLYPIARITFLSHLYSDQFGSVLGVTMAIGDLGQTVFPPVTTFLAAVIAWQAGLIFSIPLLLLVGVSIYYTSSEKVEKEQSTGTISIGDALDVLMNLRTPAVAVSS